jgi:hypothetical protein
LPADRFHSALRSGFGLISFVNLPLNIGPLPHFMILLALASAAVLALPVVGLTLNFWRTERNRRFGYTCALAATIVPPSALVILNLFEIRYAAPSLPFFLLLVAARLNELRPALMRVGLGLLLMANVYGTFEYYRTPIKPDFRGVIKYMLPRMRPGDKLAMIPWQARYSFDYNLARLGASLPATTMGFPLETSFLVPSSPVKMLDAVAPTYSRLWVVFEDTGPPRNELLTKILADLDQRYLYHDHVAFWRVSVILYARGDGGPARAGTDAAAGQTSFESQLGHTPEH